MPICDFAFSLMVVSSSRIEGVVVVVVIEAEVASTPSVDSCLSRSRCACSSINTRVTSSFLASVIHAVALIIWSAK